jgi:integrase
LLERKIKIGTNPDGTAKRVSVYGSTPRELDANIEEARRQSYYGVVDKNTTMSEWADKWLSVYKKGDVSEKTYSETYKPSAEHIKGYFKSAKLSAIRQVDVKEFYNSLSGKSQSLMEKAKITLNAMFEAAIDNELIVRNPARRLRVKSSVEPEEKRAYSFEEASDIIRFARNHKFGAAIIIMLKTGLRSGELLALKWGDVDLKSGVITVSRSIKEVNGAVSVGPPKTKSSAAGVPIDNDLIEVMSAIPRFTKVAKGRGKARTEVAIMNEYVFPNSIGKLANPHNWRKRTYDKFMSDYVGSYIKEYREINGKDPETLPRLLNPHELRHTFGSLVYEATGDIYITSKLMRHASVDITAKVYVHETVDMRRSGAETMFAKLGS